MPRQYVRKGIAAYSKDDMQQACVAVKCAGILQVEAARRHGVPVRTLDDKLSTMVLWTMCNT